MSHQMTPPKPTEADQFIARKITASFASKEYPYNDKVALRHAKLIAESHQPERKALRLAREAIAAHLDKEMDFDDFCKKHKVGQWATDMVLKDALAAIEKVMP